MEQHVKIVAGLNIALGAMDVIGGLTALFVLGGAAGIAGWATRGEPEAAFVGPLIETIAVGVFLITMMLSVPCIVAGLGLLGNRPWAHTVAVVVSAINLINIPFGTLLGIYGLWALLSRPGEAPRSAPGG